MKKILKIALLSAGFAVVLNACNGGASNNKQEGKQLEGEVKIDGSSTVYPITEAVAEEFRSEQPRVRVTVGVSGTGGGFKKFCRAETDINDASRPIKESEIQNCNEKNIDYVELSVAYDGLAVVVNPENDWVDHFTVEELKMIWEPEAQGEIKRWNQIRPEWPDEEIHLFGPGVASGTYDYFTEAVVGESGASRGDYTASEDDNVLVQGVATDKYALGFFGLAYYEENADKLKVVGVDDSSGPVKPSMETVANGTYKPLSRPLFIYVSSAAVQKPATVDFIRFYLDIAPDLAKEVGYVPMPKSAYEEEQKAFETFVEKNEKVAG